MPAPSATPSGAGNPLDAVQQLQRVVDALAPALRPQVLPKGAAYGLDLLLQQCATDAQRAALRALVRQNKPAAAGEEEGEEELLPFVVGAFDAEKKAFSIDRIDWLGQQDALVHQFPRFIELQLESPDEVRADRNPCPSSWGLTRNGWTWRGYRRRRWWSGSWRLMDTTRATSWRLSSASTPPSLSRPFCGMWFHAVEGVRQWS